MVFLDLLHDFTAVVMCYLQLYVAFCNICWHKYSDLHFITQCSPWGVNLLGSHL